MLSRRRHADRLREPRGDALSSKGLPDLVVSGINKGYNIGDDVTYSGTVAGALEAALLGIPAIAVSLQGGLEYDFTDAAAAARTVAEALAAAPAGGAHVPERQRAARPHPRASARRCRRAGIT